MKASTFFEAYEICKQLDKNEAERAYYYAQGENRMGEIAWNERLKLVQKLDELLRLDETL